jgi:hypothetical protein
MDACNDAIAQALDRITDVGIAGAALFVVIAFLALFWADEDPDEERP